jgi:hypothetical protein
MEENGGALHFESQDSLTQPLLQAYLDRAVVHMNRSTWDGRSQRFYEDTGAKFSHWAALLWSARPARAYWDKITAMADTIHDDPDTADVILEAGVMEAIAERSVNGAEIPDWMLAFLEESGLQSQRLHGPNGPGCFSYEAMFDRNAEDWPNHFVGIWSQAEHNEQSAPDITMLETQLYYAYQIGEYIDAGFEGIMFGQSMMTGARDAGHAALHALCQFAKTWAGERAYRRAVTLSSHVIEQTEFEGQPVYTHVTWPTRLSYTDETPFGMWFGPEAEATATRQGGAEIVKQLALPIDLPILLEIDNYGRGFGPSAVADEGWDEITGFAKKTPEERAAFLRHYYFAVREWENRYGNRRVHLALPGNRPIHEATVLGPGPEGEPAPATSYYVPYREFGGDEEVIAGLFEHARNPEDFRPRVEPED